LIYLDTSVALHLASIEYLRGQLLDVRLATYDERMAEAAQRMEIPLAAIDLA
jgi:hypothetical protein